MHGKCRLGLSVSEIISKMNPFLLPKNYRPLGLGHGIYLIGVVLKTIIALGFFGVAISKYELLDRFFLICLMYYVSLLMLKGAFSYVSVVFLHRGQDKETKGLMGGLALVVGFQISLILVSFIQFYHVYIGVSGGSGEPVMAPEYSHGVGSGTTLAIFGEVALRGFWYYSSIYIIVLFFRKKISFRINYMYNMIFQALFVPILFVWSLISGFSAAYIEYASVVTQRGYINFLIVIFLLGLYVAYADRVRNTFIRS